MLRMTQSRAGFLKRSILASAGVSMSVLAGTAALAANSSPIGLFVPAYSMQPDDFLRLMRTRLDATRKGIVVIDANFGTSDPVRRDPYIEQYVSAKRAGWTVLTYVPANHGEGTPRPYGESMKMFEFTKEAIEGAIDSALRCYPEADGILVDEADPSEGCAGRGVGGGKLSEFYANLGSYIRAKKKLAAANVALPPTYQKIVDAFDLLVTVELPASAYFLPNSRPKQNVTLERDKVAHVVRSWTDKGPSLGEIVRQAREDNVGYLFVNTDAGPSVGYNHLPPTKVWNAELRALGFDPVARTGPSSKAELATAPHGACQ